MKKLLVSVAVSGMVLMTSSTAFADTLSASVGTKAPSNHNDTTYRLSRNITNMHGTYYYLSVNGYGILAVDPPTVMF